MRRALVLLALLPALLGAAAPAAPEDPLEARAFEIRHKPLAEAVDLVGAILSPQGSVSLRPQLKRIVVQDRRSVLAQVEGLLRSFDLPPRNVEVTLVLFLGSDKRDGEAGRQARPETFSREVRGVTETLGDFTKWTAYDPLGSRSITGTEGSRVTAVLSEEWQVVFDVVGVSGATGGEVIELRNIALERRSRGADGAERTETILKSSANLPAGRQILLGAANGPDSKRALFLALQARPR